MCYKVIKEGAKVPQPYFYGVFNCPYCGCIFEADKIHWIFVGKSFSKDFNLYNVRCKCPNCTGISYPKDLAIYTRET